MWACSVPTTAPGAMSAQPPSLAAPHETPLHQAETPWAPCSPMRNHAVTCSPINRSRMQTPHLLLQMQGPDVAAACKELAGTSWHPRRSASPGRLSTGYTTNASQSNTVLGTATCPGVDAALSFSPWRLSTRKVRFPRHHLAPSQQSLGLLTVMSKPTSAPWPP